MKDRLSMFNQMNYLDIPNAISSPESVDGQLLCNLQNGQQIDLFGLGHAHAKTFQTPARKPPNLASATYGRIGLGSSASADLQQSLESRLRAQLPKDGWMMPFMIWKRKKTPALRQYCQLSVLVRPMTEQGYGLWRSPSASDNRNRGSAEASRRRVKIGKQIVLSMQVKMLMDGYTGMMASKGQLNPEFVCWLMGFPSQCLILHGFGNAIHVEVAAEFIKATM